MFEGLSPTIFNGVFDGPEPVSDRIFDLCERVLVGPFHQQGHGARVSTLLNERVLLLSLIQRARRKRQ